MERNDYIAAYDIASPNQLRRALKLLLEYAIGRQKSVFECCLTDKDWFELQARMRDIIDPEVDRFMILRMSPYRRPRGARDRAGIPAPRLLSDWIAAMATLYLDRKGLSLSTAGGCLEVRRECGARTTYPLRRIERVVLFGRIAFDGATLAHLAGAGIALVCLGGRGHARVAQLVGPPGPEARRRLNQYSCAVDPGRACGLARRIVEAKLRACLTESTRLRERRPRLRRACTRAIAAFHSGLESTPRASTDSLRGIEGAAAASWFRLLAAAVPDRFGFAGRNRRPPRDPVNAALSLAYTLAHADAVAQIHARGLDPMIGFLHEPVHSRESLACDLVEPLRARIDVVLLDAFSRDVLRVDHFNAGDNGCRLSKAGRATFYEVWESAAKAFRRYLRAEAFAVVKAIEVCD